MRRDSTDAIGDLERELTARRLIAAAPPTIMERAAPALTALAAALIGGLVGLGAILAVWFTLVFAL